VSRQPKVAIYARVSTDEQSPDAQLRDLREYVSNRGWKLVTEFIDIGESGSKDVRPAWSELWTQLRQRKFNVLVVPAVDRIGSSLPHLVKILAAIEEHNVTLISLREAFDLSTAQGRMLAGLFAVLADYESSLIKQRAKAGMRAARAKDEQIGPKRNTSTFARRANFASLSLRRFVGALTCAGEIDRGQLVLVRTAVHVVTLTPLNHRTSCSNAASAA
jgi:DNA invertase Pin-like site-specific DNA recombinase